MLPIAPVPHQASLSYGQARDRFHKESASFLVDDADIAHAQHAYDAAKWLGGPKVDITAMQIEGRKNVEFNTNVPTGQLGDLVGAINPDLGAMIPSSIPVGIDTRFDLSGPRAAITAVWPIYTGGLVTAQQNALHGKVQEAIATRDANSEMKDADLVSKYWGVQLARSIEALRLRAYQDEQAQVRRAQAFCDKGIISKIELMSVKVSRDAAHRELIAAQTNTRVAETELAHILHTEALPTLSSPLFVLTGSLGQLDEWWSLAKIRSPILNQIDAKRSQAEAGVKAAQSAYQPTVFAFGMRNLVTHYLTIPEPDWIAGIGVKFTLWDNRDRSASLASAKSLVDKADAARQEAMTQLQSSVEVAFLRTTQARQEYELTSSTVSLALENLRARQKSFDEGVSTALDVSQARTQLVGAQIAQRVAAYKFVVSWALLHAATGTMPDFLDSLKRPDLINAN